MITASRQDIIVADGADLWNSQRGKQHAGDATSCKHAAAYDTRCGKYDRPTRIQEPPGDCRCHYNDTLVVSDRPRDS